MGMKILYAEYGLQLIKKNNVYSLHSKFNGKTAVVEDGLFWYINKYLVDTGVDPTLESKIVKKKEYKDYDLVAYSDGTFTRINGVPKKISINRGRRFVRGVHRITGKIKEFSAAKLVADSFLIDYFNFLYVGFKDGDPNNINVSNLIYTSVFSDKHRDSRVKFVADREERITKKTERTSEPSEAEKEEYYNYMTLTKKIIPFLTDFIDFNVPSKSKYNPRYSEKLVRRLNEYLPESNKPFTLMNIGDEYETKDYLVDRRAMVNEIYIPTVMSERLFNSELFRYEKFEQIYMDSGGLSRKKFFLEVYPIWITLHMDDEDIVISDYISNALLDDSKYVDI